MGPPFLRIVVVFRIRKEAPLVYWTLRIVVGFRIRKEAPLVYWTLRIVVVFRIRIITTTILRVQ
jgi:hypothetical protein